MPDESSWVKLCWLLAATADSQLLANSATMLWYFSWISIKILHVGLFRYVLGEGGAIMKFILLVGMGVLSLSACSIKNFAIGELAPILSEASPRLQKEKNWYFFKKATPGSLQLAEVLLEAKPADQDLRALLTKGFGAYGYIVNDTEHLADRLQDKTDSEAKTQAVFNLGKGLSYGFAYLQDKGLDYEGLVAAGRSNQSKEYLDQFFNADNIQDIETVFFTGSSWLLLANLNKDNMQLVSQVGSAFELIKWVCDYQPNFQEGLCQIMSAVYLLARPKSLGGQPEKAKKILNQAMQQRPENLLIPVVMIEWYILPRSDETAYQQLKTKLQQDFAKRRQDFYYPARKVAASDDILALFNSMAERRFAAIVANEEEIF